MYLTMLFSMLDTIGLVVVPFGGNHGVIDVPCVLGTLARHDGLCKCIFGGVGLDLDLGYGGVSTWFQDMVIMMSWIAWLHILVESFDSDGLVVMVMFMMVWRL
jgi:hypothetical protein